MVFALVAFVAAVAWLQQASELPSHRALAAMLAAALALAAGAWAARRSCVPAAQIAACAAAALLGYCYAALIAQQRLGDELSFADEGRDIPMVGVIAGLPSRIERGVRFVFEVEQIELRGVHVPRLINLSWYEPASSTKAPSFAKAPSFDKAPSFAKATEGETEGETEGKPDGVRPAQRWRLTARLRRPQGTFNPAGFDGELWMLEQGVRATGTVRDGAAQAPPSCLQDAVWRFNPMIDRARAALRDRLQQLLQDRRYGPVIIALVMGDQGLIAQSDWTLFNRTGISHLVSISGLHITMIAGLVAVAAGALWRRSGRLLALAPVQTVRAFAGVCGGLGYCLLAGWGVPAQRTFVMLATVAGALLLRMRLSAAAILSSAAAVVCLWDPWAVTATGFWLSFGAVASIFLVCNGRLMQPADMAPQTAKPLPGRWRHRLAAWRASLGRLLREAARVQAAVTIGLVPLTLALFQQVSLISPVANAVAIPLVSYLVTPLALLGALACCLGQPLLPAAQWMLHVSDALFALLAAMLNWLVQLPYAWDAFPAPPAWAVAVACVGIGWLLAPAGWPVRWAGAAWLVPAFVMPPERPGPDALWLTALDVGQGMALVLETAGSTLVFDTGPKVSEDADAGARVIAPYLRARGIGRIDLLVVSHLDSDHAGGAKSLIDAIRVERVLTSIDVDQPMLQMARQVQRCEAGQHATIGRLRVSVWNPPAALYDRPRATTNSKSCVILVQQGATRILLTGDVPAREEAGIVAAFGPALPAQLMVAPHHGSKTSSSQAFIDAVRPRWVSIQAGYRSRFGHPHPEVVARYLRLGARVVRSDWSGAARWRFGPDGTAALEQWRLDHARYWLNEPASFAAASAAAKEAEASEAQSAKEARATSAPDD